MTDEKRPLRTPEEKKLDVKLAIEAHKFRRLLERRFPDETEWHILKKVVSRIATENNIYDVDRLAHITTAKPRLVAMAIKHMAKGKSAFSQDNARSLPMRRRSRPTKVSPSSTPSKARQGRTSHRRLGESADDKDPRPDE
jgi:hypothetical protein